MPVLDGIGATKALRERGYSAPIVSLSANVIESDTKAFKEAGMNDVLKKPIIPSELETILERYLTAVDKEEATEKFDEIDPESIAKSLFIGDVNIIKNLLKTLQTSFESILEELEEKGFDKDSLHKLKGVSGNMRLEILYKLVCEIEDRFESLSHKESEYFTKRLVTHIQEALRKIENL